MVWNDQDKNKSEELELIKIQQYDYPWSAESFIKHLQVFGFTLIAVSMLYLVAANWFMLPQNIQLAIPQLLL